MGSELRTINDIFFQVVERQLDRVLTYKQTVKWIPISSRELYRDVMGTARSLQRWGIQKGDRVAILSENRPEWAVADYACLMLGAVDVPVYPTLTAEQTAYILRDSGARVIFLSTAEQLKKFMAIKDQTRVEQAVVMDYIGITEGTVPMHRLMMNQSTERDAEMDAIGRAAGPEDLATIIYTSGTTGTPKGVMLTHGNLTSNLQHSLALYRLEPGHLSISFLPLSHITARHLDYALMQYGVTIAYCPQFEMLPQFLQEVHPTIFVGVPRVYEKVCHKVQLEASSGLKRAAYKWALGVGKAHMGEFLEGKAPSSPAWKLANALVYAKIRAGFGGRVRMFLSGGAPLGRDLAAWFAAMGIRIHEGYGLTETSPVIAVNTPQHHRLGTVGRVLPNLEVKIAPDGEILVKGPSVFRGYWNMEDETKAAFEDGWFKTGDIGMIDNDGFLAITDRKKELIKTSGGKFIAPQPIELALKANVLVGQAAVVGDRRKFASVLIQPNFPMLEDWAQANGVRFSSRSELVNDGRVRQVYEGILAEVNKTLAQYETIKKLSLVAEEFSVAGGELTASLKLRRRAVELKYKQQIDALYAGDISENLSSEAVSVT